MEKIIWSAAPDGQGRDPWLILIQHQPGLLDGDPALLFTRFFGGKTIPGVIQVNTKELDKEGHLLFHCELANDIRTISGHGLSDLFLEGLRTATACPTPIITWNDVAKALKIPVDSAQDFLYLWMPKVAKTLRG